MHKAKLFRGLADTSRLAILDTLRAGEQMVSEIVAQTGLSQPNVSAHLACLRECGLVVSRQEGRCVFYALVDSQMEALMEAAENLLSSVRDKIGSCSNYGCKSAEKCLNDKQCASSDRDASPALRRTVIPISPAESHV